MNQAPELVTSRLLLRPLTEGDVDWLHAHWTHPDVRRYLWDDVVIGRDGAMEQIDVGKSNFAAYGFGYWATTLFDSGDPVGFCGLRHEPETGEVELLYSLDPEYWGVGLATEAAGAVLSHAFDECGVELVVAGADPPNDASFRVMERVHMTFRDRLMGHGLDAIYYGVSRARWSSAAGALEGVGP